MKYIYGMKYWPIATIDGPQYDCSCGRSILHTVVHCLSIAPTNHMLSRVCKNPEVDSD